MPARRPRVILALTCPDRPGIVHAVSGFFLGHGGDIVESKQFGDPSSGRFFLRIDVALDSDQASLADLRADFAALAEQWSMEWSLVGACEPMRVAVLVSRDAHCLNDLLFRWRSGQLPIEIAAVVSNHEDLRALSERNGATFFHVPVSPGTKPEAEQKLLEVVRDSHADLVVLARYMQILSEDLCSELRGRAINIHHSFLPSFKGARPYHQAHARGVKLVGATAHYVTADLDEGPIIEQEVLRIDHEATVEELVLSGRDAECQALARAVRWHAERRVLLNGHRTVVFR